MTLSTDDAFNSYTVKNQGYNIDYEENAEVYVKYPDNFSDWINRKREVQGDTIK